jgi:hypothetical protein
VVGGQGSVCDKQENETRHPVSGVGDKLGQ